MRRSYITIFINRNINRNFSTIFILILEMCRTCDMPALQTTGNANSRTASAAVACITIAVGIAVGFALVAIATSYTLVTAVVVTVCIIAAVRCAFTTSINCFWLRRCRRWIGY